MIGEAPNEKQVANEKKRHQREHPKVFYGRDFDLSFHVAHTILATPMENFEKDRKYKQTEGVKR